VLRSIAAASGRGVGVVLATHDPHHAHSVGDRFLLLGRGRSPGDVAKCEVSVEELTRLASGGAGLEELTSDPRATAGVEGTRPALKITRPGDDNRRDRSGAGAPCARWDRRAAWWLPRPV